eukprot:scaffold179717_cov37-Tisochrysis_lutea.AAC.1
MERGRGRALEGRRERRAWETLDLADQGNKGAANRWGRVRRGKEGIPAGAVRAGRREGGERRAGGGSEGERPRSPVTSSRISQRSKATEGQGRSSGTSHMIAQGTVCTTLPRTYTLRTLRSSPRLMKRSKSVLRLEGPIWASGKISYTPPSDDTSKASNCLPIANEPR